MPVAFASRQVTPPVECTSVSAAASISGIRSVKPSTYTRGSPAKSSLNRSAQLLVATRQAHDRAHAGDLGDLAHGALDVSDPPAAAGDDDHATLLGQAERGARA